MNKKKGNEKGPYIIVPEEGTRAVKRAKTMMTSEGIRCIGSLLTCLECNQELMWNPSTNKPQGHMPPPLGCTKKVPPCNFNQAGKSGPKFIYVGPEALEHRQEMKKKSAENSR